MNPRRDLLARSALPALLIALTMVTAGCTGIGVLGEGDGGDDLPEDLPHASFDEAVEAPGPAFGPVDADHPLRLKLVQPSTVEDLPQGETEVWVLLYDSSAVEPVTDAEVTLSAFMPMMGHGTSGETDPEHQALGMYKGSTNLIMGGMWVLNLNVTLADGTELGFAVEVTVAGDGMMHHEPPEPEAFDSFEAALNASGVLFDPVNGDNLTETESFSDSGVSGADYSNAHPFTVGTAEAVEVTMDVTLTPGPLPATDELTFALVDADGEEVASVTVNGDAPQDSARADVTSVGDWTVDVSGQGFDASYQVNVTLRHELTLKLLDPANPLEALTGKQPIVVLLFDADDEVPELNATLNMSSWMPDMSHVAEDEVRPEASGNGTYTGFTNHVMAGAWDVNVTVVSDDGWTYEFVLGYQVHEADGGGGGGMDMEMGDGSDGEDGSDEE